MRVSKSQKNCLFVALIFAGFYFFIHKNGFLVAAALFAAASLFKKSASYLFAFWMKMGHVLGKVNSVIILSFLFFFILVPLSAVRKLMIVARSFSKEPKNSSLIIRNHLYTKENLSKPW